ncbi:MAG: HAD family phosphatase [Solirubrobacterales bacterium]|nr:HAD family phosphatase [Solirubrobacterales bacterium]
MVSENGRRHGLLVDYGGVLTSNLFDSFRAFCAEAGIEPEGVANRFRSDPAARQLLIALETGKLPEEQFEAEFGAMLGVSPEHLIDRLFAGSTPEATMVEAVARARAAGVRTGLISNSWGTRRYDRPQLSQLFDTIVISGEVGIRKPAVEIYALGLERIGLEARDCVYVDDLAFNLAPAAELGMTTVHHVEPEQTIDELERHLGVRLR